MNFLATKIKKQDSKWKPKNLRVGNNENNLSMKITKFMILIAAAIIVCSCEKEQTPTFDKNGIEDVTTRSSGSMLSFSSEDEMFEQIQLLKLMTEDEQDAWYKKHANAFVSQQKFMWQIVEELDNASSMETVREIQAKYAGQMLFNTNPDDEDIAPYIPSNYKGTEFVCDKNGNVLIAGKVRNYNNLTSYEQTSDYLFNHQPQTRAREKLAGVYAQDGKRKFWSEAYLNTVTGGIEIRLAAHKKNMFGWNKYKTSYGIRIIEFSNWAEITSFSADILNARPNYYVTADVKSGLYYPFVRGRSNPSKVAKFLIKVYSRGVGEKNAKGYGVINSPTPLKTAVHIGGDYYIVDAPVTEIE